MNALLRALFCFWFGLLASVSTFASDDSLTLKPIEGEKTNSSFILNFKLPEVSIKAQKNEMITLDVDGMSRIGVPGVPDTFTTGRIIVIPYGYRAHLDISNEVWESMDSKTIEPFQQKYRCSRDDFDKALALDEKLYSSKARFPAETYGIEDLGMMQDVHLARVFVNPIVQDFGAKKVRILRSLEATLRFEKTKSKTAEIDRTSPTFRAIARTIAGNDFSVASAANEVVQETMLVIVGNSFVDSIGDWAKWKKQKGLNVEVYTMTQAGNSKEALTTFIKNFYDQPAKNLTYVLFVGDADAIPPHFRSTSSGSAASDFPYSLVSGDDNIPDLLIGRIVAANEGEISTMISRVMEHELTQDSNGWETKASSIASNEGSNPSDVDYARNVNTSLKNNTYTHADEFFQGKGTATSSNILSALADGRSWLTYIGHGSGTSWGSTNNTFSNSTITGIRNQGMLPVIVDVACLNGSFARLSKCFGKAWVTHTVGEENAGAVAYYGASVSTSWDPPAIMATGIAKRHFEQNLADVGASLLAGQLFLIEQSGMNSSTLDNLEWYNLFGDPSMLMRTAALRSYQLSTDSKDGLLVVTATSDDGAPVSNLNVVLTREEDQSFVTGATTDENGSAVLSLPESGMTGLHLTGSGYNLQAKHLNW